MDCIALAVSGANSPEKQYSRSIMKMSIAATKMRCLLVDMCYDCYEFKLRLDLFSNKKESAGTDIQA